MGRGKRRELVFFLFPSRNPRAVSFFPLLSLRTTSLRSKAARKTKEATAEEKLRSKQDERNFRARFLTTTESRTLSSCLHCQKRPDFCLVGELCKLTCLIKHNLRSGVFFWRKNKNSWARVTSSAEGKLNENFNIFTLISHQLTGVLPSYGNIKIFCMHF